MARWLTLQAPVSDSLPKGALVSIRESTINEMYIAGYTNNGGTTTNRIVLTANNSLYVVDYPDETEEDVTHFNAVVTILTQFITGNYDSDNLIIDDMKDFRCLDLQEKG